MKSQRKAKITWANIKAVIQAFFRKKRRLIGGMDVPEHIFQQILWRRTEIIKNSPMCWYSGRCKICNCEILGKSMEDRACSISEHPNLMKDRAPCYPAMMDKNSWNEFKKKKNIKLFE